MGRNWQRERDYWLDHYGQWRTDLKRPRQHRVLTERDYIAIQIPFNLSVPLSGHCLIWRWTLSNDGYGVLGGKRAHRLAFEQSRHGTISDGQQVLHMCHRRFCVQPSHLYEGTQSENIEDREAYHRRFGGLYKTWDTMEERSQKAVEAAQYALPPPSNLYQSPHFGEPLECACEFTRLESAGEWIGCLNCGSSAPIDSIFAGHKEPCGMNLTCRCGLCRCQMWSIRAISKLDNRFLIIA